MTEEHKVPENVIVLLDVRLAFPEVFNPSAKFEVFGASFPIVPGSRTAKALEEAVTKCALQKWGAKAQAILIQIKQTGHLGYQERPKTNSNGEVYAGFEDCYTLNASSKKRPLVTNRDKSPIIESDGKIYGGCFVNAGINFWAQDNSFGKKINADLRWIQFVREGDAFAGGAPVSLDEIPDLSDGADAGDLC